MRPVVAENKLGDGDWLKKSPGQMAIGDSRNNAAERGVVQVIGGVLKGTGNLW